MVRQASHFLAVTVIEKQKTPVPGGSVIQTIHKNKNLSTGLLRIVYSIKKRSCCAPAHSFALGKIIKKSLAGIKTVIKTI